MENIYVRDFQTCKNVRAFIYHKSFNHFKDHLQYNTKYSYFMVNDLDIILIIKETLLFPSQVFETSTKNEKRIVFIKYFNEEIGFCCRTKKPCNFIRILGCYENNCIRIFTLYPFEPLEHLKIYKY